jgi:phosphatidylglycerophosphatase A
LSSNSSDPTAGTPPAKRTIKDYLALSIATVGVGYFPIAPGTMGSLVGVAFYLALFPLGHHLLFASVERNRFGELQVGTAELTIALVTIFLVTMIGVWAGTRVEKLLHRKDPSIVVIDEVAGQMIALLSAPLWLHTWWSVLTAFLWFRAFDIWKPYPIRKLEGLESGLGIMADDLAAGVYALIANSVLISGYLLWFAPTR